MSRIVAIGALAVATVLVVVLLSGGESYRVTAQFVDAGQLVEGGTVQVGARTVGSIDSIELSDDGLANVELAIDDGELIPLRRGTIARIRTVGLTGVANRFVELAPGPSTGEQIPDGGMLEPTETRGIVDLDVLFDSFDPRTRARLRRIIRNGEGIFKGRAEAANAGLAYLSPALFQSARLAEELVHDRVALDRLIDTGATTVRALNSRRSDLAQGITSTAATLRAIASERAALGSALERAPALLTRPGGVLGSLRRIAMRARPALREARPVAPRLARVLRELVPTARQAHPVIEQTRALLPPLKEGLDGMPRLRSTAVPALESSANTLIALMPILDGLRPYTPEIANGVVSGLGNRAAGYFDANGHFARIAVNASPNGVTGIFNAEPGIGGFETGQSHRCPGGADSPAADGSNPYIEDPGMCDPATDVGG